MLPDQKNVLVPQLNIKSTLNTPRNLLTLTTGMKYFRRHHKEKELKKNRKVNWQNNIMLISKLLTSTVLSIFYINYAYYTQELIVIDITNPCLHEYGRRAVQFNTDTSQSTFKQPYWTVDCSSHCPRVIQLLLNSLPL